MSSPHKVLGVSKDANPEQVKAAYRRLAQRFHPDKGGGEASRQRFDEVQRAYRELSRPNPYVTQESPAPEEFSMDWLDQLFPWFRSRQTVSLTLTPQQARTGITMTLSAPGRSFNITLPPGVTHGQRFMVEDVVVEVAIQLPPGWRREGSAHLLDMEVDYWTLVMGGEIPWRHWDGTERRLRVEPGTPADAVVKAQEPSPDAVTLLRLRVRIPVSPSAEAVKHLKAFARSASK